MEQSDSMRFLWVKQGDVFNDEGEFEMIRVFAGIYFDLLRSFVVFKFKKNICDCASYIWAAFNI